jgi:hypothetical protein
VSRKAKILSDLKADIKYFTSRRRRGFFVSKIPAKVDFPSGKSCLGGVSVTIFQRKIQSGRSASPKNFAPAARAQQPPSPNITHLKTNQSLVSLLKKSCGAFNEIFFLHARHDKLQPITGCCRYQQVNAPYTVAEGRNRPGFLRAIEKLLTP